MNVNYGSIQRIFLTLVGRWRTLTLGVMLRLTTTITTEELVVMEPQLPLVDQSSGGGYGSGYDSGCCVSCHVILFVFALFIVKIDCCVSIMHPPLIDSAHQDDYNGGIIEIFRQI